jgi:hemolysin III
MVASVLLEVPPKFRGLLHTGAAPLALAAGIVLVLLSPTGASRTGSIVFATSALANFTVSAAMHRGHWRPWLASLIERLDHASIFLLIAGSYTAFSLLMLTESHRTVLLWVVWSGAALGIGFRLLWFRAPRWLYTVIYLGLGWAAVAYVSDFIDYPMTAVPVLLVVGGLCYTLGGLVYGLRWPNPSRRWFGFHEVFHAFTVTAFIAHYLAISLATYRLR